MKIDVLCAELEKSAPLALSDSLCRDYGEYDNSGIILSTDGEISAAVFCLDLTKESVDFAVNCGAQAIITHHPAIYKPIKSLDLSSPLGLCAKNGLGVISFHLNADAAKRGIDYYFADGLGVKTEKLYRSITKNEGYGRLGNTDGKTAEEVLSLYKRNFSTEKAFLYGEKDKKINKIASFCGAGLDEEAVDFAYKNGADLVASADISHHVLLYALEKGLAVLSCTHYGTENYGMKKFAANFSEKIRNKIKIIYFDDGRLA